MTESIYILTILYSIYVIDEVEGVRFVVYLRDNLNIDLVALHQLYRNTRDTGIKLAASLIPKQFLTDSDTSETRR